ncbi:TIGR04283 family arsenosugar biosynthesis glycosyltransferase [Desulfogranum japonicum]|uniref:TIGR04283 family arsenosugar biosynthesis glycosyltransferase n=1 Tax=Desulfogranum japonicum TaxID=231447 RepID=UPI000402B9DC|nr:TIGR04283 family arsenosugar biosynthesis glycosyltransferase [Desulfogranum japonicum]
MENPAELSLIIPALNEEDTLRRLLPQLFALAPCPQVIVSDGQSKDKTASVASDLGATVVSGPPGRGAQLNRGVTQASGSTLFFLHADSFFPEHSYHMLLQTLRESPELDGGALRFSLAGTVGAWPRIYEHMVHIRNRTLQLPYGDQGFFLRTHLWEDTTQFADWPLMEDVEWWERIQRQYTMRILPWPLVTSARRFEQRGYLTSAVRNLSTMARYRWGTSPFILAKEYYK